MSDNQYLQLLILAFLDFIHWAAMTNLLQQNKKKTVFDALEVLESLESEESFVAGESVSIANVIISPPKDDSMDTDEDDENDVNCVPDNFCRRQLLSDAELDL